MWTKIVSALKAGDIKNVVPFGMKRLPAPPYIVVKPEAAPLANGTVYRIIVHMNPGQQIFLENYVRKNISDLLSDFAAVSRNGNYNRLYTEQEYTDIIGHNDDGTISMERKYYMPSIMF